MLPEENEGFEIPSFVEAKDDIDKSVFRFEEPEVKAAPADNGYRHRHAANNISSHLAETVEEQDETEEEPVIEEEPVEEPVREEPKPAPAKKAAPVKTPEPNRAPKKRRRKVSPVVMVLALIALIMALVALVLGTISLFNHNAPTPTPIVSPTPTPTASATPSPSATPDASAMPDASASTEPTASAEPTQETAAVIGRYRLLTTMNIRTGPSTEYEKIDPANIPSKYKENTDGSMMVKGTVIDVYELSEDGGVVWGRIGPSAWICIEDNTAQYAEEQ